VARLKKGSKVAFQDGDKGTILKIYTQWYNDYDRFCGVYFQRHYSKRIAKVKLDNGKEIEIETQYIKGE